MAAIAPERPRQAPARKPQPTPPRTRLHLVPRPPRQAPKTPFVILLLVLLGGGLMGLLLLNTMIDQDAFTLHDLQSKQTVLDVEEAQLHETANSNADPAQLAARAAALGMVPAGPPTFVKQAKLPKGGTLVGNLYIVQGTPTPSPAAAAATGTTATTTTPTVAPSAAATQTTTVTASHAAGTPTHAVVTPTHATATYRSTTTARSTARP